MSSSACSSGTVWLLEGTVGRCAREAAALDRLPARPACSPARPPWHPIPARKQEDEGDLDAEAAEAEADAQEKKKKTLKPPGYKRPPLPRPKPKPAAAAAGSEEGGAAPPSGSQQRRKSGISAADYVPPRRTVRDSTRQKVEEGEAERKAAERVRVGLGAVWVGQSG